MSETILLEQITEAMEEAKAEDQAEYGSQALTPAALRVSQEMRVACYSAAETALSNVTQQLGWRKRKVARAYRKGQPQVVAMVNAEAAIQGLEIDPDNLREILQVILEFIKALLSLFSF